MEMIDTTQTNMITKYGESYWEKLFSRMETLRYNLEQTEQAQTNDTNNNNKYK